MNKQALIQKLNNLAPKYKLKFIEDTLKEYPDFAHFTMMHIRLYTARNNFEKARSLVSIEFAKRSARSVLIVASELETKAKNYKKAYEYIEKLLQQNSKDIQGYYLLGQLALAEGRKEQAIINYKQAVLLNNTAVGPVCALADLYQKEKKYEEAHLVLNKALHAEPNTYFFLIRIAKIALTQKRYKEAVAVYEQIIANSEDKSHSANAAFQLSFVQEGPTDIDKIIIQLKKFITTYPDHFGLRQRLANHLLIKQQYDEAIAQVDFILESDPHHTIAHQIKANILFRQGKTIESLAIIDSILKNDPNFFDALILKANILNQDDKNASEVFQIYQKALALRPKNIRSYIHLAQFLSLHGEIKKAFILLGKGLKLVPDSAPLLEKSVQLNMRNGNYEYALALVNKLLVLDPNNPKTYFEKARILQSTGEFDQMEETVKDLRNINNIGEQWIIRTDRLIADTAFLNYDYNKAEFIFRKLVRKKERSNFEHNRLALLLLLRGDIDGATAQLEIATREVEAQHINGRVVIPLIGHTSRIINDFRIHPILLKKVLAARLLDAPSRLQVLGTLLLENPSYFGSALYLANELRSQGVLEKISFSLRNNKGQTSIPKTIIQYWDEAIPPKEIKDTMRSWRRLNPSYQYILFSKQTAFLFIQEHYGDTELKAFKNCEHPAMQADFFRLAYLSKMGGFYSDADDRCVQSMDRLVASGAEVVLKLGDFGCFSNNFLACAPGNPMIQYAFEKGVENMNSYFNEGPWFRLGPGHLTSCITYLLASYMDTVNYEKWPRLLTIDQIETRKIISQHLGLSYKRTNKSWYTAAYKKQISSKAS